MTPPTAAAPGSPEPTASLRADPAEVTPGSPMTVGLHLTNRLAEPSRFAVEVLGFEPELGGCPTGRRSRGPRSGGGRRPSLHPARRASGQSVGGRRVGPSDRRRRPRPRAVGADRGRLERGGQRRSSPPPWCRPRCGAAIGPASTWCCRTAGPPRYGWTSSPWSLTTTSRSGCPGASRCFNPGSEVRVPAEVRANKSVMGQETRRPFGVRVQGRHHPGPLGRGLPPASGTGGLAPQEGGRHCRRPGPVGHAVAVVGITALNNHLKKTATSRVLAAEPTPCRRRPPRTGRPPPRRRRRITPLRSRLTTNKGGGSGSGSRLGQVGRRGGLGGSCKSGGGSGSGFGLGQVGRRGLPGHRRRRRRPPRRAGRR